MSIKTKSILLYLLFFFVVFVILYFIVQKVLPSIDSTIRIGITTLASSILLPQRNIVKRQTGEEIQLKWFFSKRILVIK